MDQTNDKKTIRWSAEEFEYSEKSVDWFWAVGVISVGLAVVSIFLGNLLFAILIVISSFALSMQAVKRPRVINFEINEDGVIIDKKLYTYNTLESFWILNKEKIMIKSKKAVVPFLIIPLQNINPRLLRESLIKNLKEEEMSEPLGQVVMKRLGF